MKIIKITKKDNKKYLTIDNKPFPAKLLQYPDIEQYPDDAYLVLEQNENNLYDVTQLITKELHHWKLLEIVSKEQCELNFPQNIDAELNKILNIPIIDKNSDDLTNIPFVTVDAENTKDLDQALFIEHSNDQNIKFIAHYAIADPTWFIKPNTPIYDEAIKRATSIYFAGLSIPMLPRPLSNDLISLNENKPRRAIIFSMYINENAKCIKTTLKRALIKSFAKLSTQKVDELYKIKEKSPLWNKPYTKSLLLWKELAIMRINEARSRNAVHFNRVNLDIKLDLQNNKFLLALDQRTESDLYNEQLSLLCNIEGAKLLNASEEQNPNVLAIYRVHTPPSEQDLNLLQKTIQNIVSINNLEENWLWKPNNESLADYIDKLPEISKNPFSKFGRIRQAIERQILMIQRRSVFSPQPGLHSALGVDPYGRFSSPMREIVGVFTHKELLNALNIESSSLSNQENDTLRSIIIESANKAKERQNRVDKAVNSYAIATIIANDAKIPLHQRPKHTGTILGLKTNALYIRIDSTPVELKLYTKDIEETFKQEFKLNNEQTCLKNKNGEIAFAIGQPITVKVKDFNPHKQKWTIIPALD